MPSSARFRRLADAPCPLEFELPSPNGAIRDARLFFDAVFIATSLQQLSHRLALFGACRSGIQISIRHQYPRLLWVGGMGAASVCV